MNNGQFNIVSATISTPLVPLESVISAITITDDGANFAGMLNKIRIMAKEAVPANLDKGEMNQTFTNADQPIFDLSAEDISVGILTQLDTLAGKTQTTAEPLAEPKGQENTNIQADDIIKSLELTDVTPLMALAAYSQSGRMPDVNEPAPPRIDMAQNIAKVAEQTEVAVTTARPQPEQAIAVAAPTIATEKQVTPLLDRMSAGLQKQPEISQSINADKLQSVIKTSAPEEAAVTATAPQPTPAVEARLETAKLEPAPLTPVAARASELAPQLVNFVKSAEQTAAAPTAETEKPTVTLADKTATGLKEQTETTQSINADRSLAAIQSATPRTPDEETVATTATARSAAFEIESMPQPAQRTGTTAETPLAIAKPEPVPVAPVTARTNELTPSLVEAVRYAYKATEQAVTKAVAIQQPEDVVTAQAMAAKKQTVTFADEMATDTLEIPAINTESAAPLFKPSSAESVSVSQPITEIASETTLLAAKPKPVSLTPLPARDNELTMHSVEKPRNIAKTADQEASETVATAELQPEVVIAAVTEIALKTPFVAAKTETAPLAFSEAGANKLAQSLTPRQLNVENTTEKTVGTPIPTDLNPQTTPELAVEIQLSQAKPITARIASPSISTETGNKKAHIATASLAGRAEKVSELNIDTETSPFVLKVPVTESVPDSDLSKAGEDTQGEPVVTSDNQRLAQSTLLLANGDTPKVSAATAKPAPTESARQGITEPVIQQLKDHFEQHDLKPGSQQITLTLSPDNLGELKMNLNLQGQKLSVEITTENRAVREVIIQHTDALKESLARQNITMESFDVTTSGKGSGGHGQNQNAWRELTKQQQQQAWASQRGFQSTQANADSGKAAFQRRQGQSMLDIHY